MGFEGSFFILNACQLGVHTDTLWLYIKYPLVSQWLPGMSRKREKKKQTLQAKLQIIQKL